ncbi:MAG: hypothetical protein JWM02_671 [Frankiales bacterium]|nr:hypothetical protein [Frankiales bacterium]
MRIERRFNGPPGSANGGITCGLLAAHLDADVVQVTLRKPPPLDTDLRVTDGQLYDGDVLVAEAVPGTVDVSPPPAIDVTTAAAASASYAGLVEHPFPTCFVCGTARSDGLRLTAGPINEGVVATPWTPQESSAVMVWAALDCPGGWSADVPGRPLVLGRMTCRIDALPQVGEPHVVQGWMVGGEGRKLHTGSALYDASGTVLAVAQATWITVA